MISQTIPMIAAKYDQRNVGLRGTESLGDLGLRHRSSQPADQPHLFDGQEFFEVRDETGVDGVLFVGAVINPRQVGEEVVSFDAIDVIDHRQIVRIGNERRGDKSVDVNGLSLPFTPQINLVVSEWMRAVSENFAVAESRLSTCAPPIKTSHAATIANFVPSLEVNDATPFFINHSMGSCARSAHSIVVSDATQGG